MSSPAPATTAAVAPAARTATRLAFLIAGLVLAAWAPLVPYAKARAGVSDAALGLLLLCLGAGSILSMPLAGALAGRVGCRPVIVGATVLACATLPLLAAVSALPLLAAALFLFGAGVGSLDCVMNLQAVVVQRAHGRPMMSGFHGLFSVGGFAGAGAVTAMLGSGLSPLGAAVPVAAAALAMLAAAWPGLLNERAPDPGPPIALPRGPVLLLAVLCFIMFLTEGVVLDWGALFLTSVRGMDPALAGLGYAAFAAVMTAGRLSGDRIVSRLGGRRVLLFGGLCGASGLALAVLVPAWPATVAGYALVGAGCANIVPVLFSAVERQSAMPEHAAVTALTTLGYAGVLAGPALIGFIAQSAGLPAAFILIACALLAVAASSRRVASGEAHRVP